MQEICTYHISICTTRDQQYVGTLKLETVKLQKLNLVVNNTIKDILSLSVEAMKEVSNTCLLCLGYSLHFNVFHVLSDFNQL